MDNHARAFDVFHRFEIQMSQRINTVFSDLIAELNENLAKILKSAIEKAAFLESSMKNDIRMMQNYNPLSPKVNAHGNEYRDDIKTTNLKAFDAQQTKYNKYIVFDNISLHGTEYFQNGSIKSEI